MTAHEGLAHSIYRGHLPRFAADATEAGASCQAQTLGHRAKETRQRDVIIQVSPIDSKCRRARCATLLAARSAEAASIRIVQVNDFHRRAAAAARGGAI